MDALIHHCFNEISPCFNAPDRFDHPAIVPWTPVAVGATHPELAEERESAMEGAERLVKLWNG